MSNFESYYHRELMLLLQANSIGHYADRNDRTGTGCRSAFARQFIHDMQKSGFPLLKGKKTMPKAMLHELVWFIRGECDNVQYLKDNKVKIWNEWAASDGSLGPIYGKQWRAWKDQNGREIDQLTEVIKGLMLKPDSRRHIVSAWNVGQLSEMALPPCHMMFQFFVGVDFYGHKTLSVSVTQRSGDIFLGVPFNMASYAALLTLVAYMIGAKPKEVVLTVGDLHLYNNHHQQALEYLGRMRGQETKGFKDAKLEIKEDSQWANDWAFNSTQGPTLDEAIAEALDEISVEDFVLSDYEYLPWIKADISI